MTSVALSEEQRMLAATTAQLVADHPTLSDPDPARAPLEAKLWDSLVHSGLVAMAAPDERDSSDETTLNVALVVEQLARGVSATPYLGTQLALGLLLAVTPGGVEARELLAGRRGCVVLESTLCAPAPHGVAVDVGPDALAVGVDGEMVCAAVLGDQLDSIDLSRPLATADGQGIAFGAISSGAFVRWRARALALVCADLVGTCSGALDGAVAHARTRQQFGRPVGSFQAVQQLCADQLVSVEACRSITWQAAWAVDSLPATEALTLAQTAKAYCSDVARTVCEAAIQVWGGLGLTWECPAHRYLRRALLDRQLFGDERVQLGALAETRLGPHRGAAA